MAFMSCVTIGVVVAFVLLLTGHFDDVIDRDTVSATGGPVLPAAPTPPVCTTSNCDNLGAKDAHDNCLAKGGTDCDALKIPCTTAKCAE